MINKIKNPYIPDSFDGSTDYNDCTETTDCTPKAWLTRYMEVELNEPFREDITGDYTPQGGCVYGGYIYRALVKSDSEPAIIQKIRITDGEIVAEVGTQIYGHCNDMFVCAPYLYILHSASTNIVYFLDLETLEFSGVMEDGPTRWGESYNATNGLHVIGTVGSAYFSVYYNDSFMYRIKPDNAFSGFVRQGIFCTENYIGVVLDNAYGTVLENEKGSRIMFYTWNGMFIKSVYIPVKEIEWADYSDGKLYFGTYEGRDDSNVKSGKIYIIPFDLYAEQTVLTGRPTDVSGGIDNLQRLPEGTPVKLWEGSQSEGTIILSKPALLNVTADGPFRYLKIKFDGANACVCDWFPTTGGTVALREFDTTASVEDSVIRFRETRLIFDDLTQSFSVDSCIVEELKSDVSEGTLKITKNPSGVSCIKVRSIWGII